MRVNWIQSGVVRLSPELIKLLAIKAQGMALLSLNDFAYVNFHMIGVLHKSLDKLSAVPTRLLKGDPLKWARILVSVLNGFNPALINLNVALCRRPI